MPAEFVPSDAGPRFDYLAHRLSPDDRAVASGPGTMGRGRGRSHLAGRRQPGARQAAANPSAAKHGGRAGMRVGDDVHLSSPCRGPAECGHPCRRRLDFEWREKFPVAQPVVAVIRVWCSLSHAPLGSPGHVLPRMRSCTPIATAIARHWPAASRTWRQPGWSCRRGPRTPLGRHPEKPVHRRQRPNKHRQGRTDAAVSGP